MYLIGSGEKVTEFILNIGFIFNVIPSKLFKTWRSVLPEIMYHAPCVAMIAVDENA